MVCIVDAATRPAKTYKRATTMVKSELVLRLAESKPHLSKSDIEMIVDVIFGKIAAGLSRGERVELRGFGAFTVKRIRAHMGRNPATGESVDVSEKHFPTFKTGKPLQDRLNGPRS
jgi:integration host factor subunit beta